MLTGYNNNVTYQGEVFHVQTEEGGTENPYVTTLLYRGGAILAKKMSDYRDLLGKAQFKTELRQIMDRQHKTVIKALLAGRFDAIVYGRPKEEPPPPAPPEVAAPRVDPSPAAAAPAATAPEEKGPRNLDDILLDFIAEAGDTD